LATQSECRDLIAGLVARGTERVSAHTYRKMKFQSFSSPVVLACSDGHDYVVKALGKQPNFHRALCNDQIIGRLARAIGAPVPDVAIVDVPPSLIQLEPDLGGLEGGLAHGSKYISDASKTRQGIAFQNLSENRIRFALLAILYGWAFVQSDHQFFYQDGTNLVFSFDHGHFFPGGPQWTIEGLNGAPPVMPDSVICNACQFAPDELAEARRRLSAVTFDSIAVAVAAPPISWGLNLDDRVALAIHMESRKNELML
jgi:hypothetical protein